MISVVISTRNRQEMLTRCLCALKIQSGEFEVVVVDQGDTSASIPEDPRFHRIFDQERGLAKGRNTGIFDAAGNIIAFLDDDSVPDPDYIDALGKVFEGDSKLDAAAGCILSLEDGHPYARVHEGGFRILGPGDWLRFMGGNFAFRREVVDKVGVFDERFGVGRCWASGEETDYFFRMIYLNCRVAYSPAITVRHPHEAVENAPGELRAKLIAYGRGQGALIARHLVEFSNYRMLATLAWTVTKPCVRAIQYFITMRPRKALLHGAVAFAKCAGFGGFVLAFVRDRTKG
jgi:GT2 family glycosyltransferase